MPRIRKKTSKRGTTNNRKKIQQKVRESRKKSKKEAKKNPQWKSKTPRDPGIPNNLPFKDQILAEISEQRRIDSAEKLRKKEEKRARAAEEPDASNEVPSLPAQANELQASESDEDEVPVLVNRDLPNLQAVLDNSDVVIEVLDARDPLSYRSSHLENVITSKTGRKLLLVLNKIETCPRESVTAWAAYLRTQHPTVLFRSATAFLPSRSEAPVKAKGKAKEPTDNGLGVESILACLGRWAKAKKGGKPLSVSVVGVTNVGKSSLINSLIRNASLPVYTLESSSKGPTTTDLPQEVHIEVEGKQIRIIDTPGLSWEVDETTQNLEDIRARDILLRSKGRIDRLKDPTSVVANIVSRSSAEDLMLLYSLPAFAQGDSSSFLAGVARSSQLVKKRGALDLLGASRILLRDWSTGKFARYSNPPTTLDLSAPKIKDAALKQLYESDAGILEAITPRKELRKSANLVKITSGEVDSRKPALQNLWLQEESSDESGDESVEGHDSEEENEASDGDDDDEVQDEEEQEQEEQEEVPLPSKKQKRKRAEEPAVAPPSKKVAFGPDPKGSKQARLAGSKKGETPETKSQSKAKPISKVKPSTILKPARKVANAAPKGKAATKAAGSRDGEAYDFGKFF